MNGTEAESKTLRGIVLWFSDLKGYGFIRTTDEQTPDIFVHHSGILADGYRTLKKAQLVEFEPQTRCGRTVAVNVRAI